MHKTVCYLLRSVYLLGILALPPLLGSASAEARSEAGNSYYAGGDVTVTEPVSADLYVAGGKVKVVSKVEVDAALAGGSVDIENDIGQDLRVAGGNVEIRADIGGDLAAAGGKIQLRPETHVRGSAFIAGSELIIDGTLSKGAKIYADRVSIAGAINGDARVYARRILLEPSARIDGNLFYASDQPLQEDDLARVSGRVIREQSPDTWDAPNRRHIPSWFHPLFFLSMLACGTLLYLLFPNAISGARDSIAGAPVRSIVIGLALLFTLPPVAVLLMLTLVGIPLGLGLFALYPFLLGLGYLATAFFIGQKLANATRQDSALSRKKQAFYLGIGLLLLGIAGAVPILGWVIVFLSLVAGIGGWAIWATRRYRGTGNPSTI